jgi:hypothetical protein
MSSSDVAAVGILISLTVAASSWVGVWLQARAVRVSEQQLKSQVDAIQAVVDRIEAERRDREAAISAAQSRMGTLQDTVTDSHRRGWDHVSASSILYSVYTSKVALATAMLAHTASTQADLEALTRERFEAVADLAFAIAASTETDAKSTDEMGQWRLRLRAGQDPEALDDLKARLRPVEENAQQVLSDAMARFAQAFKMPKGTA